MINDPNVESHKKIRQSFIIIRTIFCRRITRRGGEGGVPRPFSEIGKKHPNFRKKVLIVVIHGLNF